MTCIADYPKFLLAGALILVSAGTASTQQGRAAGDNMLAFVSERDGNSEIYVMNVDGTGLLRLTNDAGRDVDPAWFGERRLDRATHQLGRRMEARSRSRACAMGNSAST